MEESDFKRFKENVWKIVFHCVSSELSDIYGMNEAMNEDISYAAADAAEEEVKRMDKLWRSNNENI